MPRAALAPARCRLLGAADESPREAPSLAVEQPPSPARELGRLRGRRRRAGWHRGGRATKCSAVVALLVAALCVHAAGIPGATELDAPHLDSTLVRRGCQSCHKGHGLPGSPMLSQTQPSLCLECHGSQTALARQQADGSLGPAAAPALLATVLAMPFRHPLDSEGYSRRELGRVTCTSCHSPHRSRSLLPGSRGVRKPSTADPSRYEYELCESCHGAAGAATQSLVDLSRLFSPENRSYHPVEAQCIERSPSVSAEFQAGFVNCTDCHGSSSRTGPQGVHGSVYQSLLRENYSLGDGSDESDVAYALCYACHQREAVLDDSPFPQHAQHIVSLRAACSTCHSPHGSVANRALIRFGEETTLAGVSPSDATGTLAFMSDGPGSGACFLSCHGMDHGPKAYGAMKLLVEMAPASSRDYRFDCTHAVPGAVPHLDDD